MLILQHLRRARYLKPADDGAAAGGTSDGTPDEGADDAGDGQAAAGQGASAGDGAADHASTGDVAEREAGDAGDGADAAEEPTLTIAGEPVAADEPAPEWVKDLRRRNRDMARELAQHRRASAGTSAPVVPKPSAKPELRDFDFDADAFAAALDKWHEQRQTIAAAEQKARDEQAQEQRAWDSKLTAYKEESKNLAFRDFEDVEAAAEGELSEVQRAVIVQGSDKPALVMYALGRNLKRAREFAAITDPVRFAFAIADFQKDLNVTSRKPTTKPERSVSGTPNNGAVLSSEDKKLAALRDEAARTGDMTKLMNYQREQRNKQRRAA